MKLIDLNKHTLAVSFIALLAFGLSILRDILFAYKLGISSDLDLYLIAFKIPDLFFAISTSFVAAAVMLPVFQDMKNDVDRKIFINTTFTIINIFLFVGCAILYFFLPHLSEFFYSSLDAENLKTVIDLSRILLIQVILLSISTFFLGITQFHKKFIIYSLAPLLYTFGIILGVFFLYSTYGLYGIVYGVILGSILHIGVQLPILFRQDWLPSFYIKYSHIKDSIKLLVKSFTRTISIILFTFSQLIIYTLLLSLGTSAISIFYFAETLSMIPYKIIGHSYISVSFPVLVNLYAEKRSEFKVHVEYGLIILITIIALFAGLIGAYNNEIIRFAFEFGKFSQQDTQYTALALKAFVYSALGLSLITFIMKVFYAAKRKIQNIILILFALSQIAIVFLIVKHYDDSFFAEFVQSMIHIDLPLLQKIISVNGLITLSSLLLALMGIVMLKMSFDISLKKIMVCTVENTLAVIALFYSASQILFILDTDNSFINLMVGVPISILCWFLVLYILDNEQIKKTIQFIKRLWKKT